MCDNKNSGDNRKFLSFFEKYVELEEKKKAEAEELHNLTNKLKFLGMTINENLVFRYKSLGLGISFEEIKKGLEGEIEFQERIAEERRRDEIAKRTEEGEDVHKAYVERFRKAWEEGEII